MLFAIGALGGVAMAAIRFARSANPPAWLAMLHGLLAAAGLTLTGYAVFAHNADGTAPSAFGLLCIAAVGGAVLSLRYKWNRILLPAWLVLTHALAAVAGFVLLAYGAFFATS
ncbi:MAG TPA: hypothetical protein VFX93_09540 [Xanthomonadaceae bacterium]|nr:hypothetical protein [Xanthomonadaceae bacterium]